MPQGFSNTGCRIDMESVPPAVAGGSADGLQVRLSFASASFTHPLPQVVLTVFNNF